MGVSGMDGILFSINLEVVLLQFCILESCAKNNALHVAARNKIENLQRNKLSKERCMVRDIIRNTLLELVQGGEWSSLKESVVSLQKNACYTISLNKTHEELICSLNDLNVNLIRSHQERIASFRNCDLNIATMRDKIKDTVLNTDMQLNYVDKWLFAKAEALDLEYQVEIKRSPRLEIENRVHEQVVEAYELQTKEREALLEYWKTRYLKDLADISERLGKQCEMLKEAVARRTELQKLYDLHEGEMRAWLTFKRERAARRAREERARASATRIQAWWRGVMVRRCLGIFRQLKNTKKLPSKTKKK